LQLANWWLGNFCFSLLAQQPFSGLGRLIVEISRSHTHRHTTFGRTPLGEGLACRNIRMRQTSLLQAGFEPPGVGLRPLACWDSKRVAADLRLRPRSHRDRRLGS